ncbi:CBS domain-containing protein [candidate division GN15 bacterium]|nr:CBS domain-containing protein [candidate division GN15 bacterium]
MILALLAVLIGVCLAAAYVVSLYSLSIYIDPDDVSDLLPRKSVRRRSLLLRLAGDPRALVQIAAVFKSFALVVITLATVYIVRELVAESRLDPAYLYPIVLITMWILFITMVEYLPRRSSRRGLNKRMMRHLWLVGGIYLVFFPVVRLYRRALLRVKPEQRVTEEEKEEIIERAIETLAEQAGIGERLVEKDEKKMIGQIFLLDQTQVREIMIPRIDIKAIEKTTSFAEIQALVRSDGHSRYPVYEESIDKVIGLLYVKDLFSNMPGQGEEFVITNYLRTPYFVPEGKIIGELMREFLASKLHIAMVVDEYGGVAGLVTLEDILEEIVGEIQDEHDSEVAEIRRAGDGEYIVDAALRVEKLQDFLETEYEQGEYDSVGGLIYDLVGSVPDEGERIKWHQLEFEILSVDGQRIMTVKVRDRRSAAPRRAR